MRLLTNIKNNLGLAAAPVIICAVAAVLCSCNTTGCTDNRSSIPLAGFYSATDQTVIALDSLEIGGVGAPADSLLIMPGTAVTQVYLPLRSTRTSASYFIRYCYRDIAQFDISDTVSITYQSDPYFASEECGAMFRYRITSLTHTSYLLDSVAVTAPDSVITNANIESLRFYFITSQDNNGTL